MPLFNKPAAKAAPAGPADEAEPKSELRERLERSTVPVRRGRETTQGRTMANIGKSITIAGDLTGEEDLVIEGKVDGKVTLPNSQLTVGANGTVQAEVRAKSVVVIGRIAGNVHGTDRVEIQATGVVEGDVSAPKLIVAEGAVLNGTIQMGSGSGKASGSSSAPTDDAEVRKAG
ncbi:MAG: polymer-forming cytoskeletal protein [Myxococcota bacterium]